MLSHFDSPQPSVEASSLSAVVRNADVSNQVPSGGGASSSSVSGSYNANCSDHFGTHTPLCNNTSRNPCFVYTNQREDSLYSRKILNNPKDSALSQVSGSLPAYFSADNTHQVHMDASADTTTSSTGLIQSSRSETAQSLLSNNMSPSAASSSIVPNSPVMHEQALQSIYESFFIATIESLFKCYCKNTRPKELTGTNEHEGVIPRLTCGIESTFLLSIGRFQTQELMQLLRLLLFYYLRLPLTSEESSSLQSGNAVQTQKQNLILEQLFVWPHTMNPEYERLLTYLMSLNVSEYRNSVSARATSKADLTVLAPESSIASSKSSAPNSFLSTSDLSLLIQKIFSCCQIQDNQFLQAVAVWCEAQVRSYHYQQQPKSASLFQRLNSISRSAASALLTSYRNSSVLQLLKYESLAPESKTAEPADTVYASGTNISKSLLPLLKPNLSRSADCESKSEAQYLRLTQKTLKTGQHHTNSAAEHFATEPTLSCSEYFGSSSEQEAVFSNQPTSHDNRPSQSNILNEETREFFPTWRGHDENNLEAPATTSCNSCHKACCSQHQTQLAEQITNAFAILSTISAKLQTLHHAVLAQAELQTNTLAALVENQIELDESRNNNLKTSDSYAPSQLRYRFRRSRSTGSSSIFNIPRKKQRISSDKRSFSQNSLLKNHMRANKNDRSFRKNNLNQLSKKNDSSFTEMNDNTASLAEIYVKKEEVHPTESNYQSLKMSPCNVSLNDDANSNTEQVSTRSSSIRTAGNVFSQYVFRLINYSI